MSLIHELFQSLYKIQQERRINPNYHNWNEIGFFIMDEEPQTRAEEVARDQEARLREAERELERELRHALTAHRAANPMLEVAAEQVQAQNVRWTVLQDPVGTARRVIRKPKEKQSEVPLITESDHFL